jgi:hypothetical protein
MTKYLNIPKNKKGEGGTTFDQWLGAPAAGSVGGSVGRERRGRLRAQAAVPRGGGNGGALGLQNCPRSFFLPSYVSFQNSRTR